MRAGGYVMMNRRGQFWTRNQHLGYCGPNFELLEGSTDLGSAQVFSHRTIASQTVAAKAGYTKRVFVTFEAKLEVVS